MLGGKHASSPCSSESLHDPGIPDLCIKGPRNTPVHPISWEEGECRVMSLAPNDMWLAGISIHTTPVIFSKVLKKRWGSWNRERGGNLKDNQFSLNGYFSDSMSLGLRLIFLSFYTNFSVFSVQRTQVHRFKFKSSLYIFTELQTWIFSYFLILPLEYIICNTVELHPNPVSSKYSLTDYRHLFYSHDSGKKSWGHLLIHSFFPVLYSIHQKILQFHCQHTSAV